jgi:hypothetical protein
MHYFPCVIAHTASNFKESEGGLKLDGKRQFLIPADDINLLLESINLSISMALQPLWTLATFSVS